MTEWPTLTLEEICAEGGGFVRTGPFGSQLHKRDYIDDPTGIPVLMPKDMSGGSIDLGSIARIGEETADRLSHHLLSAGDVALARRGDVGRSAFIAAGDLPVLCGTGSMRVHLGEPESVLPQFLRYFFRSRLASGYLEGHAVGATMPNLNAGIVNSMPMPVPPLQVQAAVGAFLGSIDDLIANNRRRVAVLEEMARAIYREWFVHFRFPGHADIAFVDSDIGPIPETWTVRDLDSLVTERRSTVGPEEVEAGVPLVGLQHLPRRQLTLEVWEVGAEAGSRKKRFLAGDILFGKIRPYFHKVVVTPLSGTCSTDALVFEPSGSHRGQAIMTLSSDAVVAYATQTSNGTKMPRPTGTS